jgi:hypothetical protein
MRPAYHSPVFFVSYIAKNDVTYCCANSNNTLLQDGICRILITFLIFSVKNFSFYTNKTKFFTRKSQLLERKNFFLTRKSKLYVSNGTKLIYNWIFYTCFSEKWIKNGLSVPLISQNSIKKSISFQVIHNSFQVMDHYLSIKMFLLLLIRQNRPLSAFSLVLIAERFCRQLKNPDSFFICYNICLKTKN